MRSTFFRLIAGAALLTLSLSAQSTINCTASSNGFTTGYNAALPTTTIAQTSVTVSCTRASGDPTSISYTIKVNNGLHPNGTNNRAQLSSFIKYDIYTDSACTTQWKGNTALSGTINFNVSPTSTTAFWGCVPAAQNGLPGGTYADTVTMTLTYGASTAPPSTFPVSIITPFTCSISLPPGTVAFGTYTAFGPALNASTSFGVTCSSTFPYSLAVSPAYGVINGLNYSVSPSVSSSVGSGVQQLFSINGAMPGGQAGTCATGSCPAATQSHVLTLTY